MVGSISEQIIIKKPEVLRAGKGASLISLLLKEDFTKALAKVKSEARKSVCVKADGGENLLVLPLHIACAIPKVPHDLIKILVEAYPEALMCRTTLKNFRASKQQTLEDSSSEGYSSSSTIPSSETASIGVGWLPIHVAALYGVQTSTMDSLLVHEPGSVYCKTTQGFLPLHIACRAIETSHHLIETLLRYFPQSIYVPTSGGILAGEIVEMGSGGNYSEISQLLVTREAMTNQSLQIPRPLHSILNPKRVSTFRNFFPSRRLQDIPKEQNLFKALSNMEWNEALNCLSRKPKYAKIWTLSPDSRDPPCHLLPLHLGLRRNAPLHVMKAILDANPNAIHKREFMGMLPLHLASHLGMDSEIINFLCEAHPKAAKRVDLIGMLPLHFACKTKNPNTEVITYLLKQNPSGLHEKDSDGFFPQEYLATNSSLLAEFKRGETYWGSRDISENQLASLICRKQWDSALLRVNEFPREASTWTIHQVADLRYLPLHYACILKAPIDLINALLGVYPDAALAQCQEYDMLPLHLTLQHGSRLDIVEALLQSYGKAVSVADSFGLLPLHLACTQGANLNVISALVKANPDACQAIDRNGYTPKIYASNSMLPHSKMVMQLLETP